MDKARELTDWYTVKIQNAKEQKIADRILLEMERLNKKIKIVIPKEKKVTAKRGKKHVTEKVIYPGYLFIETTNLVDLQNIIRSIILHGHILCDKDKEPIRLRVDEVKRMLLAEEEFLIPVSEELYVREQVVNILTGVFEGWDGIIKEVDIPNNKVRLTVSIFKKETTVELSLEDITKI